MQLGTLGLVIACLAALLAGVSRTGMPGLGTFLAPLVAMAMPARASTGFLLIILVEADLVAAVYWRRTARWRVVARLLPWTFVGILAGFAAMNFIGEAQFRPLLGGMIVGVVALETLRRLAGFSIPRGHPAFSAVMGILAGIFTMMANAAGPVMTVYLLSMELPKEEFVGTSAVFFWIVNLVKLPLSVGLGLVTPAVLSTDALLFPLILVGMFAGRRLLARLPQAAFQTATQLLAAAAGLKLLF